MPAQVEPAAPTRQEVVDAHLERMLAQPHFPAFSQRPESVKPSPTITGSKTFSKRLVNRLRMI